MTDWNEMQAALEAILFVSSEPVPRARLLEIFDEGEREEAGRALDAVLERHGGGDDRGFMMDEAAGGVRLVTRPELNGWLRRFFDVSGARKLSMGALETLAIIAYRQPITGPEIQELRSVSPSGVLKTLLEKRLIRIQGRKEVVGKPFLYATTREFLVHFGLNSLKDLPPLEELEEALADGELLEALGGVDREEEILRAEAKIDEAEAEAAAKAEREVVEAEREAADAAETAAHAAPAEPEEAEEEDEDEEEAEAAETEAGPAETEPSEEGDP
jgi:segregation and condensation protein B